MAILPQGVRFHGGGCALACGTGQKIKIGRQQHNEFLKQLSLHPLPRSFVLERSHSQRLIQLWLDFCSASGALQSPVQ